MKPGYPRKYCFECSAKRKAAFETSQGERSLRGQEQKPVSAGLMSVKDISITSQCLVKAWANSDKSPQEVLDAYRFFKLSFELLWPNCIPSNPSDIII